MGTKPRTLSLDNPAESQYVEFKGAEYRLVPGDELAWGDMKAARRFSKALQAFVADDDGDEAPSDSEEKFMAQARVLLSRLIEAPDEVLSSFSDRQVRQVVDFWCEVNNPESEGADPLDETSSATSPGSSDSTEAVPKAG